MEKKIYIVELIKHFCDVKPVYHCFSESRGTIIYKNAVIKWLDIAGAHCKEVTDYFLQDIPQFRCSLLTIGMLMKKEGRIVEVIQCIVFRDPDDILRLLGADSGGKINTSYVERFNLTIRNCLARFIRKGMNYSENLKMHSRALDFIQAWYNFVKPHKSLRIKINFGKKKWMKRISAVAEKPEHVWILKKITDI